MSQPGAPTRPGSLLAQPGPFAGLRKAKPARLEGAAQPEVPGGPASCSPNPSCPLRTAASASLLLLCPITSAVSAPSLQLPSLQAPLDFWAPPDFPLQVDAPREEQALQTEQEILLREILLLGQHKSPFLILLLQ